MAKADKRVLIFAVTAFVLLGVLFGMQIMAFIFGNLGESNSGIFTDESQNVTNLSAAFINTTVFAIPEASEDNFSGSFVVTLAFNDTSSQVIQAGNYTVNTDGGTITNASAQTWANVSLSYTYNTKTDNKLTTESISNNSLQAIGTYTEQANTQFNTVAIAITLIILIMVFLLFWNIFIKGRTKKANTSAGNFG